MPEHADELTCKCCGHKLYFHPILGVRFNYICKNVNCPSKSKNPNFAAQHERYLDERAGDSNR